MRFLRQSKDTILNVALPAPMHLGRLLLNLGFFLLRKVLLHNIIARKGLRGQNRKQKTNGVRLSGGVKICLPSAA